MDLFKRFLLLLCFVPGVAVAADVATTAGSNLTAWNGNIGVTNNNNWNTMMNSRNQAQGPVGEKPKADFGNCNALILRCAEPRCSGCTSIDIARPIVTGCVNTKSECKKHGTDLIEYIAAQIVSETNARLQQQDVANKAAIAKAEAQAAQSNDQIQQLQQQIGNLSNQLQQQKDNEMNEIRAALDAQRQEILAEVSRSQSETNTNAVSSGDDVLRVTDADKEAIDNNISEDVILRSKISGEILSEIDSAEDALKKLYASMQTVFRYAGCDERGENCSGPKRVKAFKQKARAFIRPYDQVAESMYNALEMALAVGVDISDVMMMLNGSCNRWGKFLCVGSGNDNKNANKHDVAFYNRNNCSNGRSVKAGIVRGGHECISGMAIPAHDDARCTLTEFVKSDGDGPGKVSSLWIAENEEGSGLVRLGCATAALDSIPMLGRVSGNGGQAIGLDVLERILAQDAPDYSMKSIYDSESDDGVNGTKYCAVSSEEQYMSLVNAVQTKKLPSKICISRKALDSRGAMQPFMMVGFRGSDLDDLFTDFYAGAADNVECTRYSGQVGSHDCVLEWKDNRCKITEGTCKFYEGVLVNETLINKIKKCLGTPGNDVVRDVNYFECFDNSGNFVEVD